MSVETVTVGRWCEMHVNHPLAGNLKKRLTLSNPKWESAVRLGFPTAGLEPTIPLWEEVGNRIRFPRAVAHNLVKGFPIVDATSDGHAVDIPCLITPREYQHGFLKAAEEAVETPGRYGVTLQAQAGFGKTVCGLYLISKRGRTAIIIVHKEFLMSQWVERLLGTVEAAKRLKVKPETLSKVPQPPMLGIAPEDVGIIQGKKCEWKGKKVVVAMVQSLAQKDYDAEMYDYFGTLLFDECHRAAAPTFTKAISRFSARIRIGVTATPDRKDKLQTVFFAHIGGIGAVGEVPRVKPRLQIVETIVKVPEGHKNKLKRWAGVSPNGEAIFRNDFNKVLDYLTEHEARNRWLVNVIIAANKKDRKVIVLSHRREHLETLHRMFVEECQRQQLPFSIDYYVGGMDLEERKRAERMQNLLATVQMAEEGLDIPALDTLVFATPGRSVEQAVGRVQRTMDDKKTPVVVDMVDMDIEVCVNAARARQQEYKRLGWL